MLAINLAAAAIELGKKPIVIDQDQQGTTKLYYKQGNLPFEVINSIPATKPDCDVVIFDHQASDWEIPKGKIIVMPLKPARDQYATYIDAHAKAVKAGKEIISIVTDCNSHRIEEVAVRDAMKTKGAFVIPSSGVFGRAATEYRTIFDEKLNKAYKVKERRRELLQIMTEILIKDAKGE